MGAMQYANAYMSGIAVWCVLPRSPSGQADDFVDDGRKLLRPNTGGLLLGSSL